MAGGIKVNLKGFEKMLEDLKAAGKDAETAAENAIKESAQIVETELKAEAKASNVPDSITDEIRKTYSSIVGGGIYEAEVGWHLEQYHPQEPSAGYKAMYLNYGTVRRTTRAGKNRGEIHKPPRTEQFIYTAKKKSGAKIRKLQKEMLKKVMDDLK